MTDKPKSKPTDEEVQAWLDGVHFSSSCNLPLSDEDEKKKTPTKNDQSKSYQS